jgi:hypothetical protein
MRPRDSNMIMSFIIEILRRLRLPVHMVPTKDDLDRNLSTILHDAHHKAQAEKMRLMNEFAARGLGRSGTVISAVVGVLDGIHKDAVNKAIPILGDFAQRMQVAPSEIVRIARPHLENLGNSVLGQLPSAGFPHVHQKIHRQYMLVFAQRLNGALRDFEIGFTGGRSVVANSAGTQPLLSKEKPVDLVTLRPGFWGVSIDLREAGRRLKERWARRKR